MFRKFVLAALFLASLLGGAVVAVAPLNSYEWMLGDLGAAADGLTFCALPLDDRQATALVPLFFVLPSLSLGALVWVAWHRGWPVAVAVAPFTFWVLRFLVFFPGCGGDHV